MTKNKPTKHYFTPCTWCKAPGNKNANLLNQDRVPGFDKDANQIYVYVGVCDECAKMGRR